MNQIITMDIWIVLIVVISFLSLMEILLFVWVNFIRNHFPWLITKKDEYPQLSKEGLEKFIPIGFDPELGWIRKPNTSGSEISKSTKSTWTINSTGSRTNPDFEKTKSLISCYGDSFTFARQVNDDQTWEHFLSKKLITNVLNFGVGNHGIDQSLLRLKRDFSKNRTKIVILGVVPDTISRILSIWKHYYEYGNTFAFKPRFMIKENKLILIENLINDKSKFFNYTKYLKEIQKNDFFYEQKFKKEQLHFPYILSILKNMRRNIPIILWITIIEFLQCVKYDTSRIDWNPMKIIMKINLKWRIKLYKNQDATKLLDQIIQDFISYSVQEKFIPVFVFLPQKDDIIYIKNNFHFYKDFINSLSKKENLIFIDIMNHLLQVSNLDEYYSDDNEYGGHYSKFGNEKISEIMSEELLSFKSIKNHFQ
ncbi:MAG: hypothetical protein CXT78_03895 [Thaumarchaeota archaeon]|nr:MAG: hypothetical protein CXT78_03895 [Nitrososphaerota archaeon]